MKRNQFVLLVLFVSANVFSIAAEATQVIYMETVVDRSKLSRAQQMIPGSGLAGKMFRINGEMICEVSIMTVTKTTKSNSSDASSASPLDINTAGQRLALVNAILSALRRNPDYFKNYMDENQNINLMALSTGSNKDLAEIANRALAAVSEACK